MSMVCAQSSVQFTLTMRITLSACPVCLHYTTMLMELQAELKAKNKSLWVTAEVKNGRRDRKFAVIATLKIVRVVTKALAVGCVKLWQRQQSHQVWTILPPTIISSIASVERNVS